MIDGVCGIVCCGVGLGCPGAVAYVIIRIGPVLQAHRVGDVVRAAAKVAFGAGEFRSGIILIEIKHITHWFKCRAGLDNRYTAASCIVGIRVL